MKSQNRDVKFIIYQALYILIICIVAIKGASLDLAPVDLKDSTLLKPKYAYMYIDTSANKIIDKNDYRSLIRFDSSKMVLLTRDQFSNLAGKDVPPPPPPIAGNIGNDNPPPKILPDIQPNIDKEPVIGVEFPSNFIQYHENSIRNANDIPLVVKTSAGSYTIPAKSTKAITLGGDNTVTLSAGNESKTYTVKENQKPKINLLVLVPQLGNDISLREIESQTGYRVTITDDYINQLDYKISGPVTFKEVSRKENEIIIDVNLNFLGSSGAYDKYEESRPNEEVHTVSFSINVKDRIAPQTANQIGVFKFTKW